MQPLGGQDLEPPLPTLLIHRQTQFGHLEIHQHIMDALSGLPPTIFPLEAARLDSRRKRAGWVLGEVGDRRELPQRGLVCSPDRSKVYHYFQH